MQLVKLLYTRYYFQKASLDNFFLNSWRLLWFDKQRYDIIIFWKYLAFNIIIQDIFKKLLNTILKEPLLYNDTDDVNKSGSFLCDSAKKQIEEERL